MLWSRTSALKQHRLVYWLLFISAAPFELSLPPLGVCFIMMLYVYLTSYIAAHPPPHSFRSVDVLTVSLVRVGPEQSRG